MVAELIMPACQSPACKPRRAEPLATMIAARAAMRIHVPITANRSCTVYCNRHRGSLRDRFGVRELKAAAPHAHAVSEKRLERFGSSADDFIPGLIHCGFHLGGLQDVLNGRDELVGHLLRHSNRREQSVV